MISRTGKSYSYSHMMHQFKQKLHCQLSERERTIPPYFSPHSCMIGIGTRSRAKISLAFVCEWLWASLFLWKDGQKGNEGRFTRFVFTQSYKSVSILQTHTSTHTHPFTNFFFFLQGWSWGQLRRTKCIQEATTSTAKGTGPTALKQNGVDMSVRGENIERRRDLHMLCKGVYLPWWNIMLWSQPNRTFFEMHLFFKPYWKWWNKSRVEEDWKGDDSLWRHQHHHHIR